MVAPWAEAVFLSYCDDLQHPTGESRESNSRARWCGCSIMVATVTDYHLGLPSARIE